MFDLFRRLKMQVLLTAVLTLILGIILLFMPGMAIGTLLGILGWVLVITGVVSLLSVLLTHGAMTGQGDLVLGLLELASGIVVLMRPDFLVSLLGILLGLLLVMHGARDIQSAREAKALGFDWKLSLGVGVVTVAMGAIVIFSPVSTARVLLQMTGAFLIVDAVGDLILIGMSSRA